MPTYFLCCQIHHKIPISGGPLGAMSDTTGSQADKVNATEQIGNQKVLRLTTNI